jgi:hypothetical protein
MAIEAIIAVEGEPFTASQACGDQERDEERAGQEMLQGKGDP